MDEAIKLSDCVGAASFFLLHQIKGLFEQKMGAEYFNVEKILYVIIAAIGVPGR